MPDHDPRPTGLNRRGLLAAVGGVAAAVALPTTAAAVVTPTAEFHEIVRVAASTRILWDQHLTSEGEEQRQVEVDRLEAPVRAIEKRLASEIGPDDAAAVFELAG